MQYEEKGQSESAEIDRQEVGDDRAQRKGVANHTDIESGADLGGVRIKRWTR